MVTGRIYRFITRARNAKGDSEDSLRVEVALAAPLSQPATPQVDRTYSGADYIYITWTPST